MNWTYKNRFNNINNDQQLQILIHNLKYNQKITRTIDRIADSR